MHRLPGGSVGGLWEFPGGKCEPGETPQEALKREWLEETGLEVDVGAEIGRGSFQHKGEDFELIAYEVALPQGARKPALKEHDDWRWVRLGDLGDFDIVESDHAVVRALERESG
jgi:mutator protein MutT